MRRFAVIISSVTLACIAFVSTIQYLPSEDVQASAYCGDMLTPAQESESIDRNLATEGVLKGITLVEPLVHTGSTSEFNTELELQKFLIYDELALKAQWTTSYNKLNSLLKIQEIDLPLIDIPS